MLDEKIKANIQERLSHLLRSHRLETKLTQTELGKNLHITLSSVAKLENPKNLKNRALSSLEFFDGIGEQVGMSLSQLLSYLQNGGADDSPYTKNMLEKFSRLRADIQFAAIKYFEHRDVSQINDDFSFLLNVIHGDKEKMHLMKAIWINMGGRL